jgi:hypothetical protein
LDSVSHVGGGAWDNVLRMLVMVLLWHCLLSKSIGRLFIVDIAD